jgi:pSer/pThr/pTyr-binding forkhead associated (FHA) protein
LPAYLEAWRPPGPELMPLDGDRVTIGSAADTDLVIGTDPTVSRLHAVIESVGSQWVVRDLGSRNGTFVNGERLLGDRVLRAGDELRVGATRIVFRGERLAATTDSTQTAEAAPELTRRERDVLMLLCRPVFNGDLLTEPASVRTIAAELVLTESAVKKHLLRLYDKFELFSDEDRRRGRLANEAIRRGAVTLADLRARNA